MLKYVEGEYMKIPRKLKILTKVMIKVGITLDTAKLIANNLETNQEYQEMTDYLIRYQNIITDHQAIQHLEKIVRRRNQEED